ncbi:septal ring lytic transglycosylase RlpA family protein [Sphingomonas sp. PB4P5]|uniref:septal ring lytic transglycosylase RlpA family protein n=1 Tax=Parasphingomonas puruogangriensis TaxID=3096155 RepID=UPI002FCB5A72
MLSNTKSLLGFTLLLAGCAGGGGTGDAPRIDGPSARALDAPYAPREEYPPVVPQAASAPGAPYRLQGDYPPEPGVGRIDTVDVPPSRVAPGANYDAPAAPYRPMPLPADAPPAVAASTGPRGTSGEQQRYDAVGYASWYGEEMGGGTTASGQRFDPNAITAAHRTLPLGSVAEVTALDSGRTILVLIADRGPGAADREIDLSRGAAQLLGVTAMAPVRVRLTNASPQDVRALRSGQPAGERIDAPPTLLTALRRKLPTRAITAAPPQPLRPVRPNYTPPAPRPTAGRAPVTSGLFVQVAALSNEGRAQALATSLGGRVQRIGAIFRVQIGPYANTASAQRARDEVARRGYGDARIVTTN